MVSFFEKHKKKNDSNLLLDNEYQDVIINSCDSFVGLLNSNQNFIFWNKMAEEITGYSEQEILKKDISFFFSLFPDKEAQNSIQGKIKQTISNGQEIDIFEKQIQDKNKETRSLLWKLKPLLDKNKKTKGCIIIANDISEKKRLEAQLRQAQKMETLGVLVGGIAHDFNNILGGIMGTLSLMRFTLEENAKIEKKEFFSYLEMMQEAGNRATNMIKRLLSFSKKQKFVFQPIDLNTTIKNVIRICENSFDKSIEIKANFFKEPAIINADLIQMEQVILNFCVNASHAMTIMRPKDQNWGGILSLSISEPSLEDKIYQNQNDPKKNFYWLLSIQDYGVGIDSASLNKIFDPFFTTKKEGEGSGLGLTMVDNIVKQHGGFINVESNVGQGTLFKIYLPKLDKKIIPKSQAKEKKTPLGKGLILIVDDEEMIRRTVKTILERTGYEVMVAENGEKGVALFEKHHREIKVVLLDMVMPQMSGEEAFMKMKKIDSKLNVLLVSGFKQDDRVNRIMELGVKGFIQKPFTLQELATPISKLIKSSA